MPRGALDIGCAGDSGVRQELCLWEQPATLIERVRRSDIICTMTDRASILEAALELSPEELQLLVEELQDQMAMNVPEGEFLNKDIERAWDAEISRRIDANPAGVGGVPLEEVLKRLEDMTLS